MLRLLFSAAWQYDSRRSIITSANFVAGSCSIPALIWLIYGYYRLWQEQKQQQCNFQEHLRQIESHNTTFAELNEVLNEYKNVLSKQELALKTQAEFAKELKVLVSVEHERVKGREEIQATPILIPQTDRIDGDLVKTYFVNRGGSMRDIRFHSDGKNPLNWHPKSFLGTNAEAELILMSSGDYPLEFNITCLDGVGYTHEFGFKRDKLGDPWKQICHSKGRVEGEQ